jgi:uncharacterized RDD family membrane protein YckC
LVPSAFPEESRPVVLKVPIGARLGSGAIDIILVLLLTYCIPVLGAFAGVAYYLSKDALPFLNGQSFGKKAFQLRVVLQVKEYSIINDYRSSFLRSFTLFIPVLNLVELILVVLDRRRLGDRWAGTFTGKNIGQKETAAHDSPE